VVAKKCASLSLEDYRKAILKANGSFPSDMSGTVDVLVEGGKANPGPPIGPVLGPTPVDVQAVVSKINEVTASYDGTKVPVKVIYQDDGSFEIEVGSPPTAALIKKVVGIEKGSGVQKRKFVGDITIQQIKKIAEQKLPNLLSYEVKNAAKEIAGTCVALGVTIDGRNAREFKEQVDSGVYDEVLGN
jgi:large subunit ribosomal protein L11